MLADGFQQEYFLIEVSHSKQVTLSILRLPPSLAVVNT